MNRLRVCTVAVCTAACLSLLLLPPTSAQSVPGVVISEFRVRGPNGGNDEFVELFNTGTTPVAIGGWKINGSNASGTASTRVTIAAGTMLGPGCHFLATNSGMSGGPYSGSVPGDQTYGTGITDDGGIALLRSDGGIADAVGLSTGSAYKEGTPLATLGSSNQNRSYARKAAAGTTYQDTGDNSADFDLIAPSAPQALSQCAAGSTDPEGTGTATPEVVEPGGTTLLVVEVAGGTNPASTGIAVTADLTPILGDPAQPLFDDGTHGDAMAGDLRFSLAATVAAGTPPGAKIISAHVADAQGRSATAAIALTVPQPPMPIHAIQGSGLTSPFEDHVVATRGIVTAVRTNGFFVQSPDAAADADEGTSEGLFVFTGFPTPAAIAVGQDVTVAGRVQEFRPGGAGTPSITELSGNPGFAIHSTGNPLPAPGEITASEIRPPADAIVQLERLEGMRITGTFETVSPTAAFGQTAQQERNADPGTSRGEFFVVPRGVPRPFREPGLEPGQLLPPDAPCCVPRFDGNLERLRVDSDGQRGAARLDVPARQILSGLAGVLDFGFGHWTILPDPGFAAPQATAAPVRDAGPGEFTIASFNMERFFDTTDDDAVPDNGRDDTDDTVLTAAAFDRRLRKASLAIRDVLRAPDVLAVVEVENLSTLQSIAARVNADAVAAGAPDPAYVAYLEEGNDIGGIDVGFLVRSARVDVQEIFQIGETASYVTPDGATALLNDRPSLVLRAAVRGPIGDPYAVTIIANHLRSLNGVDDPADGARVRAKRRAQAEFLANYVQSRQAANPAERIIAIGDFNAFQFNDGFVDSMGTIAGQPTQPDQVLLASDDLVDPNLVNLIGEAPPEERYSFVFDGNPQALDHAVVNGPLRRRFTALQFGRSNADFPEWYRQFADRPERLSDHDPLVAYFAFPSAPVVTLNGPASMTVEAYTGTYVEQGASAADEDGSLAVTTTGSVDVNTPGVFRIRYTASNGYLTTTAERVVHVVDSVAPAIGALTASPAQLWPPNHKLIEVIASYSADDASGAVACSLEAVSNEADNGRGDGNTAGDVVPVDAHRVYLRAERAGGGPGRAYTLTVTCGDPAGNTSRRTTVVRVER